MDKALVDRIKSYFQKKEQEITIGIAKVRILKEEGILQNNAIQKAKEFLPALGWVSYLDTNQRIFTELDYQFLEEDTLLDVELCKTGKSCRIQHIGDGLYNYYEFHIEEMGEEYLSTTEKVLAYSVNDTRKDTSARKNTLEEVTYQTLWKERDDSLVPIARFLVKTE